MDQFNCYVSIAINDDL